LGFIITSFIFPNEFWMTTKTGDFTSVQRSVSVDAWASSYTEARFNISLSYTGQKRNTCYVFMNMPHKDALYFNNYGAIYITALTYILHDILCAYLIKTFKTQVFKFPSIIILTPYRTKHNKLTLKKSTSTSKYRHSNSNANTCQEETFCKYNQITLGVTYRVSRG